MTDNRRQFLLRFAATALAASATAPEAIADGATVSRAVYGPPPPAPQESLPAYFNDTVGRQIFFAADDGALDDTARAGLDRQIAWLKRYDRYLVQLWAHADDRGSREANLALSERRGQAVKAYMAAQGIAADRIEVLAFGRERPANPAKDAAARAANRRVVTELVVP